jgi:hypothetical protein
MPTTERRHTFEELDRLGSEIFQRRVQPGLQPTDEGKFVAIDVESGEFEIDKDDYTAVDRLQSRLSNPDIWLMRAGYDTTYTIGTSS